MAGGAFPRRARLCQPTQFRAVFARGQRYTCDAFVLVVGFRPNAHARLGFALSKRRLRRSVDRNRVKRVVRESFRSVAGQLRDVDIVVLARGQTLCYDNAELFVQLAGLWARIARDADQAGVTA